MSYHTNVVNNFLSSIASWRVWTLSGFMQFKKETANTIIGVLWMPIGVGLRVVALAYVFGTFFGQSPQDFVLYLAVGVVYWQFMSGAVSKSLEFYRGNSRIMMQFRIPSIVLYHRDLFSLLLAMMCRMIVLVPICIYYEHKFGFEALLFLPWVLCFWFAAIPVCMLISVLCLRLPDFRPAVSSILQVFFFITPVLWPTTLATDVPIIMYVNPFYHFLEVARNPLLGLESNVFSFYYIFIFVIVSWFVAIILMPLLNKNPLKWSV